MKIAVGNSRMDKKWKNRDISWEDLCQRVSSTIRTTETVEEYRKLKKGAQDNIKDVGGFVGGQLREGRRKNGMVLCRSMLTLDMDYGIPTSSYLSICCHGYRFFGFPVDKLLEACRYSRERMKPHEGR